jgi:hypothetical protein
MGNEEAIKDMIEVLEGTQVEKPIEEPAKVEEKVEEPIVEEPVVEEQKEEAPVVEEPDLAAENNRLRQMLNDIAKRVREPGATPPVPPVPGEEKPVIKSEALAVIADYITDEEADQFIDQPKAVLMKVLDRFATVMQENTLRNLPSIVGDIAQRHITMYEKVQGFYRENKDLEEFRDFCGLVGTQIEVEHPDWSVDQIYSETAKVARARLGLRQAMQEKEAPQETAVPTKTGLPSGHRASRKPSGGPQLSPDQQAMVELLNLER